MTARPNESGAALRTIAVFKILEAVVLVLAGLGALGLLNGHWDDLAKSWLDDLALHPGRRMVARAAAQATTMLTNTTPARLVLIGAASFAYAAVFIVEGIGLWLGRRWAEYLTIFVTASFLPFEVAALMKEHTPMRAIALAVNVIVVGYLVVNLVRKRREDGRA